MTLTVQFPCKTVSVLNKREHWSVRAKRAKNHRRETYLQLRCVALGCDLPCIVTLTRIAPRELDGHDNLSASLKACADGVADFLAANDRDPRITWRYAQRKGKAGEYAVEVNIA